MTDLTDLTGPADPAELTGPAARTEPGAARNVFFVGIDVDSMGGSQRVLHTLAQGMSQRGHRVHLIGIRPSPEPFPYNPRPSYAHSTLYSRPPAPAWRPRTIGERLNPAHRKDARRSRADQIQARKQLTSALAEVEDGYIVFGSPWAADWVMSLEWAHLKGIGQYHESFLQARTSANLRLIKRHYARLEKTLVLSAGDAEEFERQRVPNVSVMPNPLPFFPDEPAPLDTRRVGAVGRLDGIKRLDRLIDAFAAALPGNPGWELHLFGDGPLEDELRAHAERRGVAGQVVFRGSAKDMAAAYRELSVVVISSEREGRPMALAEASACGVPCVSFDLSGGVRELVADGVTGTLVPRGDVPALGEALGELMGDGALRARYGAAAREHVADLALPRVLDRWDSLFAEIARASRHALIGCGDDLDDYRRCRIYRFPRRQGDDRGGRARRGPRRPEHRRRGAAARRGAAGARHRAGPGRAGPGAARARGGRCGAHRRQEAGRRVRRAPAVVLPGERRGPADRP
jgi:glycosyltransferase involved in cell wall biosynthesis